MNSDDLSGEVGKGVQPPDGTTERRARERAAFEKWLADAPQFAPEYLPHKAWADQYAWCAWLDRSALAYSEAVRAEPSMSTTSPPENSGTDEIKRHPALDEDGHCTRCGLAPLDEDEECPPGFTTPLRSIEGVAKP